MNWILNGRPLPFLIVVLALVMTPGSAPAMDTDWKALFFQGNYKSSSMALQTRYERNPQDPEANHYLGRCYLAENEPDKAFAFLSKAVELSPFNADFRFWLGVNYWALFDFDKEMESYQKALELDDHHIQSMVYLGHAFLDRGEWGQALAWYETVLGQSPEHPEALYNKGLAYMGMQNETAAADAWEAYLEKHHSGAKALPAVGKLNGKGIFTFREYVIGNKAIVVKKISFQSGNGRLDQESYPAIRFIGEHMVLRPNLVLHVVAYEKGRAVLAEQRAKAVKKALLHQNPALAPSSITVSWFDIPQAYQTGDNLFHINSSIQLMTEMKQ